MFVPFLYAESVKHSPIHSANQCLQTNTLSMVARGSQPIVVITQSFLRSRAQDYSRTEGLFVLTDQVSYDAAMKMKAIAVQDARKGTAQDR